MRASLRVQARVAAIAALAATTACALQPGAEGRRGGAEDTASQSSALTNASTDDADPAVAVLLAADGPTTRMTCGATLVSPTVLLTAAHCLSPIPPTSVHFGSSLDDGGPIVPVWSTAAHPAYDPLTLDNDIAVVVLSIPAPVAPVAFASTSLPDSLVDQQLRLVGWGTDTSSGSTRVKRTGLTRVASETATELSFSADPSSTCFGDSGGAAFATLHGSEVLVGVTSSGSPDCTSGQDVRVDAYATFVTSQIQATVPALASVVAPGAPGSGHASAAGCAVAREHGGGATWWLLALLIDVVRRGRRPNLQGRDRKT